LAKPKEKAMIRLSLIVAAAAFGSDVGWQPLPDGGTEYIIQLNPYEIDALRRGLPFQSDIPRRAGEVRAYRIMVGTAALPRRSPPSLPTYRAEPARPTTDGWPALLARPESSPRAAPPAAHAPAAQGGTAASSGTARSPVGPATPAGVSRDTQSTGGQANRGDRGTQGPAEPAKPWLWLTVTLLLFASLGSNVYLGWIALDLWRRCRRLMTRTSTAAA
jgi:hypothetical protein